MTTMPNDADQLPENNRLALRRVARACRKAALATNLRGSGGMPYASLVTVAFDHDLSPVLLLSGLADHTKNLDADARVSLLLDGTEGHPNPQTGPRVTLIGRAQRLADGPQRLKTRFMARHPGAALYAGFADFALWRVIPERAHFVGGFGRAVWFDAPFGLEAGLMAELAESEESLLAETNLTHAAALLALGNGWRVTALDSDGIDLTNHDDFRRAAFPVPIAGMDSIRPALAELLAGLVPRDFARDLPH